MAHRLAAAVAAIACLVFAGAAVAATIRQKDARAQQNARNLTSEVESCWTDTQDYRKCRTADDFTHGEGKFSLPLGSRPGQVRVARATKNAYRIDAYSRSGNHFYITKLTSGRLSRTCTRARRGRCPASGRW